MDMGQEELSKELTSLCLDLQSKYQNDRRIVKVLEDCLSTSKAILPFISNYDVTQTHKANGYRTILMKFISLLQYSLASYNQNNTDSLFALLDFYLSNLIQCDKWITDDQVTGSTTRVSQSLDTLLNYIKTYYKHADASELLFSSLGRNYDHTKVGIALANLYRFILATSVPDSAWVRMKNLFSSKCRLNYIRSYYNRPTIGEVLRFVSKSESVFMTTIYPFLAFSRHPYTLRTVTIPSHRPYIVYHDEEAKDFRIVRNTVDPEDAKYHLKCLIFKSSSNSNETASEKGADSHQKSVDYSKCVFIYIHGGGFVMGTTELTKNFLPSLCCKMPGLTVVAVHYEPCPGYKFPSQTQQSLDATLFFTSARKEVESILGFYPTSYLLGGDSSGSVNSASTLVAINEINQLKEREEEASTDGPEVKVPFPAAFVGVYPLFYVGPMLSPSLLAGFKDVVLFPNLMLHMGFCQLPDLKNGTSFDRLNSTVPWFTKDESEILPVINEYEYFFQSPYFSPLCYKNWSQIAPFVDLILFTVHDDPLLDLALTMVPIWKAAGGQVDLNVAPRLKHGCFYFMAISRVLVKSLRKPIDEAENVLVKSIKSVLEKKILPN